MRFSKFSAVEESASNFTMKIPLQLYSTDESENTLNSLLKQQLHLRMSRRADIANVDLG